MWLRVFRAVLCYRGLLQGIFDRKSDEVRPGKSYQDIGAGGKTIEMDSVENVKTAAG